MVGVERHPDFKYPDEEYKYHLLAKEYGWTVEQVDNTNAQLIDTMVAIIIAEKEVIHDKQQS